MTHDRGLTRLFDQLAAIGEGRLSTSMADREIHGRDEGWRPLTPPDAVFFPRTTEETARAVKLCAEAGVPIIPFGAGTSLEGQVLPIAGGVTFDMRRMEAVLEVRAEDFYCVVQPGITRGALNSHLRDTGLFFPIDPGADASVGGMASTRASGTNAVRYGTMRDAVMALEVVLPSGEVIRTGGRTRKSAAGLDLTALFVGSEGLLGIITELTIRLHPIPEAVSTTVAAFPDMASAVEAVTAIMQSGLTVGRIEFIDELYADALIRFEGLDIPQTPQLFLEFSGTAQGAEADAAAAVEIAREWGALEVRHTADADERARLWKARHRAYWAGLKLRPGARAVITDLCVPMSALVDQVVATREDLDREGFIGPILGHVGDGNFHCCILIDPEDHEEVERAEALHGRMVARALAAGGTCTGEHGIGLGKREFMELERGPGVEVMRSIKALIDPAGLFNPGKML